MLTIRLQRMGKTHYATYRVVVQDVRQHPSSGKVVAYVGSYNPHTKEVQLDKESATKYLTNGAQPTERVAKILAGEGIELPKWVKTGNTERKRAIRNPEKLRKNQPKEEPAEETEETKEAEAPAEV